MLAQPSASLSKALQLQPALKASYAKFAFRAAQLRHPQAQVLHPKPPQAHHSNHRLLLMV